VSINELLHSSRIRAVAGKDVHIGWKRADVVLCNLELVAIDIEYLDSSEPKVVHVAPSLCDDELQSLALRQSWQELQFGPKVCYWLNLRFSIDLLWRQLFIHDGSLIIYAGLLHWLSGLLSKQLIKNIRLYRFHRTRLANIVGERTFNPRSFAG
jgi:hypothetical protein